MSQTAIPATVDAAAQPEPELNMVWLPNGVPLVIGGGDKAIELMRAQGFQIFYMLTELKWTTKDNNITKHHKTTRLVKVVANIVGNAIVEVDTDSTLALKDIRSEAKFSLPKIPYDLVYKVDRLFRYVHEKHKTEAIILWTYDSDFLGTDDPGAGWGYLVPKQTNTAASCKYDPQSIIDEKDDLGDTVMIVGSAHSHPAMSAYASHTDEADQGQFDGLHMTYGWPPGSKQTTFHIELQMGGGRFVYAPEAIFADMPAPEVEEDIEDIVKERVGKVTYQGSPTNPKGTTTWSPQNGTVPASDWSKDYSTPSDTSWVKDLPKGCPNPREVTLIRKTLLSETELTECPVCNMNLFPFDRKGGGGQCWQCFSFFLTANTTLDALIEERSKDLKPTAAIDFKNNKAERSVWIWEEVADSTGNTTRIVDQIRPLWLNKEDSDNPKGPLDLGQCAGCKNPVETIIDGACICGHELPQVGSLGKAQKIDSPTGTGTTKTTTTSTESTGSSKAGGSGK